jgi:hypothetical protein
VHLPSVHVFPVGHVPQELLHPSVPHSFPEQFGEHFFFFFRRIIVMVIIPEKIRKGIISFFQFIYLIG